MSVGEVLAEAREAAGLSVDEVSERTAIREIVIRSIERDDFESLGGDLYVRGYLRKIAGAVGIDPRPLIRAFDARSNGSGGWSALGTFSPTGAATGSSAATGPASRSAAAPAGGDDASAEPVPAPAPGSEAQQETAVAPADWPQTGSDAWGGAELAGTGDQPGSEEVTGAEPGDAGVEQDWAEPGPAALPSTEDSSTGHSWAEHSWSEQGWTEPVAGAVWADPVPLESADPPGTLAVEPVSTVSSAVPAAASPTGRNASGPSAVPATRPARRPGKPQRPRTRVRGWRWVLTISGLTIVVAAIVGVAATEIISKLGSPKSASAAAIPARAPTATPSATAPSVAPSVVQSTPPSKPTPTYTAKPPAPVRQLAIQADGAFGPDGLADGDNPQGASHAITSDASAPWRTNWYTTADFGRLKHGTGLLLDMGKRVTITSVTIQLGDDWGAGLQLRAGDEAGLSEMPAVASAADAGGQLTMRLKKPARARYVLIWFVYLPPSGGGRYTGSVYSVTVKGRP